MAVKTYQRGENVYKVTSKKSGTSIQNVTKDVAIPLDTDTARRILKGDRRYVEVK